MPGPMEPATQRGRSGVENSSATERASSAARLVELTRLVGQSVLGQDDRRRAERVGLDDVTTHLVEAPVHLGHQIGPGLHQPLVASLELRSAEVVGTKAEQLQVRTHGAVEDDDAVPQCLQVRGRGRIEPPEKLGDGATIDTGYRGPRRAPETGRLASRLVVPRIYTKKGDDGTTGLLFGGRVRKDWWRIELNGAVDEAQAAIGLAHAETEPGSERTTG